MKRYRVAGGVARIGQGEVIEVDEDQYKSRAHNVEVVKRGDGGTFTVRAKIPLEFKVGEEIGLPDLPKNLVDILEPAGEPESKADRVAAQKSEEREAAAARKGGDAPRRKTAKRK